MKFLLIMVSVLILLSSCTKKNDGSTPESAKAGSVIDYEFVTKISPDNNPDTFTNASKAIADNNGNIYILDPMKGIYKFDQDGKFLKMIGSKGSGPGEYNVCQNIFIVNTSLYALDMMSQKFIKFNLDGQFLEDITGLSSFPVYTSVAGGNISGLTFSQSMSDNSIYFIYSIAVMDTLFNEKQTLWKDSVLFDPQNMSNMMDMGIMAPLFASGEKFDYFADKSTDHFLISKFDKEGNKTEIKKGYRRISYTKEELEEVNAMINKSMEGSGVPDEIAEQMKAKYKYKNAINMVKVDYKGRLWVQASKEEYTGLEANLNFDIYIDDTLVGTVDMKDEAGNPIKKSDVNFFGDLIVQNDMDLREVKVYRFKD
ncbi:MAG: 6-bladed beta-propeller [Candidatus Delongbacteria bacterium]|nr:6-bladed beta-propeller [Candidatus Delongbacteria bacterium]MBN2836513.1 6-bladed beta-propeller [Candidatus Delongbacteria bacterium]